MAWEGQLLSFLGVARWIASGAGVVAFYCNPIVQDLIIDHTDATANTLQVLEQLLEQNRVQWSDRSRYSATLQNSKLGTQQVSAVGGNSERAVRAQPARRGDQGAAAQRARQLRRLLAG